MAKSETKAEDGVAPSSGGSAPGSAGKDNAPQVLTIVDDEEEHSKKGASRPSSSVAREASVDATAQRSDGAHVNKDAPSAPASRAESSHFSRVSSAECEDGAQRDAGAMDQAAPSSRPVSAGGASVVRRPSDGSVRMDPRPPTKPATHSNHGSRPGSGRLSRPGSRGGSRPGSARAPIVGGVGEDAQAIVSS